MNLAEQEQHLEEQRRRNEATATLVLEDFEELIRLARIGAEHERASLEEEMTRNYFNATRKRLWPFPTGNT